jgi:hypothetical protein
MPTNQKIEGQEEEEEEEKEKEEDTNCQLRAVSVFIPPSKFHA